MSPGPTFDRVYAALKAQLLEGRWAPGARLEPGPIGEDLHASVTPVRDALHRLVGERLVETPPHDGFRVPVMTEADLRGLYAWRGTLVGWALRRQRGPSRASLPADLPLDRLDELFLALGRGSDNLELERAMAASTDRLAPYRAAESETLAEIAEEHAEILRCLQGAHDTRLRRKLAGYHRRRERAAPMILAARHRAADFTFRR